MQVDKAIAAQSVQIVPRLSVRQPFRHRPPENHIRRHAHAFHLRIPSELLSSSYVLALQLLISLPEPLTTDLPNFSVTSLEFFYFGHDNALKFCGGNFCNQMLIQASETFQEASGLPSTQTAAGLV